MPITASIPGSGGSVGTQMKVAGKKAMESKFGLMGQYLKVLGKTAKPRDKLASLW